MSHVYKICDELEWQRACAEGQYGGSEVDLRDGFIHLSAAHQLAATAARHFAGRHGLVLVAYAPSDLAPLLRWDASRGGDLFPHVYGPLDPARALWVKPLPLSGERHILPPETGP